MRSLKKARETFFNAFNWTTLVRAEYIATVEALGRVTLQPIFAAISSPSYYSAAMDGIAVTAKDTFRATEENPLIFTLGQNVFFVNTGKPLPIGTDAVIMIEQIYQPNMNQVEIRTAAFPWQHVRKVGEDIVSGEMLLPHYQRLGAVELASLLTAGVFRVRVFKKPRIAIIATGTELLDWHEAESCLPKPGQIIETNSTFLASLVQESGGEPVIFHKQPDRYKSIRDAIIEILKLDFQMVIVNAGASAGSKDFSAHVLEELGQVLVHGITVMPGKPSILGKVNGKPVVISPGYPVSAWVCFDQLVRPVIYFMQGQIEPERETMTVVTARRLPSKLGQEEFLRVHLGRVGKNIVATPLKRGAGVVTSLGNADGILRIDAKTDGIEEGSEVKVELIKPRWAVEKTLVVVGSHDITLDLLADYMKRKNPYFWVTSSNVGSLSGLMAIKTGRCHIAGIHLLNIETGDYNVSYVQKYLSEVSVKLITLAWREQGFIVRKNNPKKIRDIADLTRPDVIFINRQTSSGTRLLLDYFLKKQGIDLCQINGYANNEYTHTAVAVQILSGMADCGLGILAAAQALNLDFIPLCRERYDLCIPIAYLDDSRVIMLLEILHDKEFRRKVGALGGYDVQHMGEIAL